MCVCVRARATVMSRCCLPGCLKPFKCVRACVRVGICWFKAPLNVRGAMHAFYCLNMAACDILQPLLELLL